MPTEKRKRTVIIVAVVLAVLLGACLCAAAAGFVGFWIGRGTAATVRGGVERQPLSRQPFVTPQPEPTPEQPEQQPFTLPSVGGAVVTKLVEDGPAARAGIRVGDAILAVDSVTVDVENPLEQLIGKHKPGDQVEIKVWSQGRERAVKVTLTEHPDDSSRAYLGVYYVLPMQMEEPSTH